MTETEYAPTQDWFNQYVADWDEVLTYQEVQADAYSYNLDAAEAIAFAAKENLD